MILAARAVLLALLLATPAASLAQDAPAFPKPRQGTPADLPAGAYDLDPTHASLIFRVDHLGLTRYTARFTRFDATLTLDPAAPASAALRASVDAASLETDFPKEAGLDFNAMLRGKDWLDAGAHPTITFRSTAVTPTGPTSARIDGELTLKGVTSPVTLIATFNGGYVNMPMDTAGARIGFSATGSLKRSAYGISAGIPEPGSALGVGDTVEIILEAEFLLPKDKAGDRPFTWVR